MENKIIIHIDGASKGNPGKSGAGIVINYNGSVDTIYKNLGEKTNNQAEYLAAIIALEYCKEHGLLELNIPIYFKSDSMLLVKQIQGNYQIKNDDLRKLHSVVNKLMLCKPVYFDYIPREQNKQADALANQGVNSIDYYDCTYI